jgi:predicted transport protein
MRDVRTRDLYNFRSRSYWLRRLENHDRKERVLVDEYTIEHILPQNENLSVEWKSELGPDWQRIQKQYLHTLGNLTLTGYNPELSDHPFSEKRATKGGFAQSPIRINIGLAQLETWNEESIKKRAQTLASQMTKIWPAPELDTGILEAYKPKKATTEYTIDDHPYLAAGAPGELFESFRRQVLAMDPCVTEEFLKLYVAYKAETNFVDVIPRAKRLRLALYMPFPEVVDVKGICRDVTGLGRWGNGDVEVVLSSMDELPYVIGLVRQSLERQMGDNGGN